MSAVVETAADITAGLWQDVSPDISSSIDVNLGGGGDHGCCSLVDAIIEQGDTAKTSSVCFASTLSREMEYNWV